MYFIWSLVCSIILFTILQMNEYNKNVKDYDLYSVSNIGLFLILYILLTIIFYYVFDNEVIDNNQIKENIDNMMLKQIKENVYTGFNPVS
jgi:NADH:ubiquinone oxidoreductase subunit 6 (subunit J)